MALLGRFVGDIENLFGCDNSSISDFGQRRQIVLLRRRGSNHPEKRTQANKQQPDELGNQGLRKKGQVGHATPLLAGFDLILFEIGVDI
jgi:hypothetical protein